MKNNKISEKDRLKENIESFRINFEHSIKRKNVVVGFTSTDDKVHKTDAIVSLARSLSKSGKKVVLIDANFRNPEVGKVSRNENVNGLRNILIKRRPYENEITQDIYEKNLDLILTGDIIEEPVKYIDSEHMKQFIYAIRTDYDYVLIDTPSNKNYPDANLISTIVDGFIVVTKKGESKRKELDYCVESIEKVGGRVYGIVVTNCD